MKTRSVALLLLVGALILTFFSHNPAVLAQSNQTSYTVNLNYLSVKISYPSNVLPGDNVSINLEATAKRNLDYMTLNLQVFYSDGSNLTQVTSASVSSNYLASGASISKTIFFTIPQDAPRTSLVASLSENVQSSYYAYPNDYYAYYYYPVYNSTASNCYYYPDWYYYDYGYCTYNYAYPYYPYFFAPYPTGDYYSMTDTGVAPLSYIKATTPEYAALQSQYQTLQQQLAQSQAQNQQLTQNLQNAQSTISQQNVTIALLNQQLSSSHTNSGILEVAAGAFAVVAIGLFVALLRKGKDRSQSQTEMKLISPSGDTKT